MDSLAMTDSTVHPSKPTPTTTLYSKTSANPNIVGMHYKVGKKLGEGSFGTVYEGVDMLNNVPVAIKFEPRKADAPQLKDEFKAFKVLANSVGIPNAYYFGQEGLHNVMCLDLLGPSLEDMFELCKRKFSIKTVCLAAVQMITRVQTVHERNLVYRDIKPDNFLLGNLQSAPNAGHASDTRGIPTNTSFHGMHAAAQIHLIDFGMAKLFRDPKTLKHIAYRERKSLSGTARYMSINTHLGREQSRRDDLESLGHVFVYFLRGSLPWQGLKAATTKQKYEKIGEMKQSLPIEELCEGFPQEFSTYLKYCRDLTFEETPDYDYLRGLFSLVLKRTREVDDGIFDWMIVMNDERRSREAPQGVVQDQNGQAHESQKSPLQLLQQKQQTLIASPATSLRFSSFNVGGTPVPPSERLPDELVFKYPGDSGQKVNRRVASSERVKKKAPFLEIDTFASSENEETTVGANKARTPMAHMDERHRFSLPASSPLGASFSFMKSNLGSTAVLGRRDTQDGGVLVSTDVVSDPGMSPGNAQGHRKSISAFVRTLSQGSRDDDGAENIRWWKRLFKRLD
ncbi:hypothetical protein HDU78_002387 [Chytriomyces hyalinus]|nr:hypothetical protein HDU78_002387 [Chytriomyces hyalinus]